MKTCYQCENEVAYLFSDSRCGDCTRETPEEVRGDAPTRTLADFPIYIDVYMPIAGWKARMMVIDEDCGGMHTPWETGYFAFATKAEAVRDAKAWARAEGVPYINTCPEMTQDAPDESVEEQLQDILGPLDVLHL